MNIIPEPGLVVLQAVPFFLTLGALHYILFKPMLAYLDERDAAIEGVNEAARQLQEKVATDVAEWETRLSTARTEMASERGRLHQQAEAQRKTIVDKARADAETRVSQALAEILRARDDARVSLQATSNLLARSIVGRILDREV